MTWLRSLVFNVVFFCLSAGLSLWGLAFCQTETRALAVGRLWGRLSMAAARRICGITLKVSGAEHLPTVGAGLIASAHQSAFDTMVWFVLLPLPAYVLKHELTRLPGFGPLTLRSGMIPVERTGGAGALRTLVRRCGVAMAAGRQIVIFPQGTRTAPNAAVALHPGVAAIASHTGLPVIPVWTNSGLVWGRRRFAKRRGVVHMRILPPLPPGLPRKALIAALEAAFLPVDKDVQSNDPGLLDHENVFL